VEVAGKGANRLKVLTSARVALITVVGGLMLSIAAFAPVYAGNHGDAGNKNAGCNQNKATPEHHYDADCDGSASENGGGNNGGGNSDGGGKPCAGCVGKADNKHPPGQEPDENDRNKGYECDDNKGVGARRGTGNPAHTGCRVKSTTTTPPPPPPSTPPGNPPTTPPGNPPTNPPDDVLPTKFTSDGDITGEKGPGDGVGNEAAERAPRGRALPFTGASVVMFLVIGASLIGAGIVAARRKNR